MRRVELMAIMSLALLGPAPVSATVTCAGDWPRMSGGQAWRCTGPDWLVGPSAEPTPYVSNRIVLFQAEAGQVSKPSPVAPSMTGWQRAGVYGLEFGGAVVGTCIAAAAGVVVRDAVGGPEWTEARPVALGLATYTITGALLSASATHLVGKMIGHERKFLHALAGGAAGGLAWSLPAYLCFGGGIGQRALTAVGLSLSPICAVLAYNAW